VHLLRTAAEASTAAGSMDDPAPLLLGALLHDAGKIGRGSHIEVGEEVAARALDHLGARPAMRDDVLFLVRHHLLLADTATRRDIGEEEVVLRVARSVGDERRLSMLSVVTMADAAATGPAASSTWRLGLVRDLVARVEGVLRRGLVRSDDVDLLARAERAVREALETAATPERSEAFLRSVPSAYLRWVRPADAPTDLDLVVPRPADGEVRAAVAPAGDPGGGLYRVAVAARDRPGLLATIAGACTVAGLSILSAQIFTTSDGAALDVFVARGTYEDEVPEERWERLRRLLGDAISGETDVADAVDVLRRHARSSAAEVPVTVRVDPEASDFHTVIEVGAADRPGLLFDLARAFSALEIDVHLARVATYGHRVVDVFYVTDLHGKALPRGVADSVSEKIQKTLSAS
jgi:[protein-PII] uridylyltransferase